ncbi:MAG TPA: hypothetical protein VN026_13740 [Bacteroidia bacterium]|jgi:hypothetical protein|nr:hypothetical protein [Bacteroidia bacterium]
MKNKKFTIGLTLLMAGSLFLTNCTKNKTNQAPSPDYEFESTKDIVKVQNIVTDIYEIAGQAGDGASGLLPYLSYTPLSVMQGTVTVNSTDAVVFADPIAKYYTVTFANTVGKDGHVRNGILKYDYSGSALSTVNYNRQPTFSGTVTSTGYTVDDYSVTINSMVIKNTTPIGFPTVSPFFPSAGYKLTWNQTSNVSIVRAAGTETLNWAGSIDKTLLNTNNTAVPMPLIGSQTFTIYPGPAYGSLNWAKAYNSYSGTGVVTLPSIGACNLTMTNLTRNMNSSPETFYAGTSMLVTPERHPFISGLMSFKPGAKATRDVDFGTADVVDYNAKVTISGITYDVDIVY